MAVTFCGNKLFIAAAFLCCLVKLSECSGKLEVMLLKYENPEHTLLKGDCCVKGTSNCRNDCSNQFQVCLSSANGNVAHGICDIGRNDLTHLFDDVESFDVSERRFQNPLTYNFNSWNGSFKIDIKALHDGNLLIAEFEDTFLDVQPNSDNKWEKKTLKFQHRRNAVKSFILQYRVLCNPGFTGSDCTKSTCTSRDDDQGHFTCTADNKGKVCLPGWWNPELNCTVKKCVPENSDKGHYECDANNTKICLSGWLEPGLNCTIKKCVPENSDRGHYECDANNTKVCLAGWLQPELNCTVEKCVPRDDSSGHYTCDEDNNKQCLDGWKDLSTNCTQANLTTTTPIAKITILPSSQISPSSTSHIRLSISSNSILSESEKRISLIVSSSKNPILDTIVKPTPTTQFVQHTTSISTPSRHISHTTNPHPRKTQFNLNPTSSIASSSRSTLSPRFKVESKSSDSHISLTTTFITSPIISTPVLIAQTTPVATTTTTESSAIPTRRETTKTTNPPTEPRTFKPPKETTSKPPTGSNTTTPPTETKATNMATEPKSVTNTTSNTPLLSEEPTHRRATAHPSLGVKKTKDEIIIIIVCVAFVALISSIVAIITIKKRYNKKSKIRPSTVESNCSQFTGPPPVETVKQYSLVI